MSEPASEPFNTGRGLLGRAQRSEHDGVAPSVAARLERGLGPLVGGDLPIRLRAWDGSEAGPADAPHDLAEALTHVREVARRRGLRGRPTAAGLATAIRAALQLGALGRPPGPPDSQASIRGRLHSRLRDRRAISHHYDLSNEFYRLILDETMAYSSAYWCSTNPAYSLADAQRDKLSLVCRKLALQEGMRLLDVGCGWGSLSLHAAEHFGATVTGITISAEQKKFIDERIRERGLEERVEIRLLDYRDMTGRFDAVASIEMGEHVGASNYPTYVEVLRSSVRPGGRVLVQQMSRAGGHHPGGGPFIESFIAPDMHMRPVGETVAHLEDGGLEVRDVHGLREHYVRTVEAWIERFETNRDELRSLVGEEVLRVWRLYLVGGAMAFRDGRMGVDQILAVRPGARHDLPAERAW